MKGSQIIGKKVIDANAYEIGKISDVDLDFENAKITKIYLSPNELSIKRHNYEIAPEAIKKIGDYILINIGKDEIIKEENVKEERAKEIPDVEIVNPDDLEDESSN